MTDNTFMFHGVRCVVFDLGGVVINIQREKAVEALVKIGLDDADDMLNDFCQRGPFLELETGQLSDARFYDEIRTRCVAFGHTAPTDAMIEAAFTEFMRDLPVDRLVELRRLRYAGLKVLALSNTNPILYDGWIKRAFRQQGLGINDYFDGIVASFMEGVCKPDPRIFQILKSRYGLEGGETLYLDDGEKNCLSAMREGIQAVKVGTTPCVDDMLAITSRIALP